jgi:lipopolysaccharide export system permease protein
MCILDRYIASSLLKGYGSVLLILVAMFSFLAFVQELDSIGKGSYGAADAWQYVALTLPRRILDLAPAAVPLGGILGLEWLSWGRELVAMRASGMSMYAFSGSVVRLILVLVTGMVLCNQFVVPLSAQFAERERVLAMKSRKGQATREKGFWARDERQALHIGAMWQGRVPSRLELYQFDSMGKLVSYIQADRADVDDHEEWDLKAVREKLIGDRAVIQQNRGSMKWKSFLGRNELELLQSPAETLSISSLYQYVRYLRDTGQKSDSIELTLWKKIVSPLSVGALALLVVPLGFTQRRPNTARQLMLGTGISILFFLLKQISTSIGLAAGLGPPLIAAFPLAVLISLTCCFFWKVSSGTRWSSDRNGPSQNR